MKKILLLSLLTSPLFSMQLALLNTSNKAYKCQEKTFKHQNQLSNDNNSHLQSNNKMRIEPSSVFVPHTVGSVELYHSNKGFSIHQDGQKHHVKKYFTDKMLHNIDQKQLKSFLEAGYLSVNKMNDGEFSLKANGRVVGGGPILGTAAYWITKSLCYGIAIAAVSTATVTTGGAIGGAVGGVTTLCGTTVTGVALTTTAATTITTTAGVVTGTIASGAIVGSTAGVVGGVITGAGLAGEAALVTGAVVTGAGSVGTAVAAVEAVSVAVGSFFGMLPTP